MRRTFMNRVAESADLGYDYGRISTLTPRVLKRVTDERCARSPSRQTTQYVLREQTTNNEEVNAWRLI